MIGSAPLRCPCGRVLAALLLALAAGASAASDFRSVVEPAVLYDAPSHRATKLFVIGRNVPVEVIASDGTWVKVRDHSGDLAWIEKKALSERRTLVVSAALADVHERPEQRSPVAFQAQQGVLLEVVELDTTGWVRVRHSDGSAGYVRISQVWGI